MMEKELSRVNLPRIRTTLSQTVITNQDRKRVSNVDLDVQSRKHNINAPVLQKQHYWISSQVPLKNEGKEAIGGFGRQLKASETSSKSPQQCSSNRYSERTVAFPLRRLRRHHSEPLLQQRDRLGVCITSLALNQRTKDKAKNPEEKLFTDFLPSVFLDTMLSNGNPEDLKRANISQTGRTRKKNLDKSRNIVSKDNSNQGSKDGRIAAHARRKVNSNNKTRESDQDNAKDIDIAACKPHKHLPTERRLTEQIDSFEINRKNENVFPRRITIRTSKSCPTIVIHECGDDDETTDTTSHETDFQAEDSPSQQLNGSESLKKDTTSFVVCWRPKKAL
ncbi:hypothetical protein QZH41_007894 [Actinostola sp. cb2023]|nr:hypothetical protein QZH41_007894 [Actinostola sp. cb2023]